MTGGKRRIQKGKGEEQGGGGEIILEKYEDRLKAMRRR